MRITTHLVLALLGSVVLFAADVVAKDEVFRWVDENGVVHFGNHANAPDSAEKVRIAKPPKHNTPNAPVPGATAEAGSDEPQPSYAQQLREERAAARKKAAVKERETAEACNHYQNTVTQLEPAVRVMVKRKDGSVVRMDDNDRLEKLAEAKAYIAENCNK